MSSVERSQTWVDVDSGIDGLEVSLGGITDKAANGLLEHLFGIAAYPLPEWIWAGLSIDTANLVGIVREPVAECYGRLRLDRTRFDRAIGGALVYCGEIRWPTPEVDWGVVRSVFLATEPHGGTVISMADVAPRNYVAGSSPKVVLLETRMGGR